MDVRELLELMMKNKCSDLHITVGSPPIFRKDGKLIKFCELDNSFPIEHLSRENTKDIANSIVPEDKLIILEEKGEVDFSYALPGLGRFRVNTYKQRGCLSIAIRAIPLNIPTLTDLGLSHNLSQFSRLPNGLVLVTGPTGSGKSTTLAALIDLINRERSCHIITLEDPIEYLHKHKNSIINQRELGSDTQSFANALRASLRQDPDVILIGEMRDIETMETALKAAETGHLVFATLHTNNAVQTIDRIVDVFPPSQQQQVKVQLAAVLRGIISQRLLPLINGGRTAVQEILIANSAIRSLIRDGKTHQIQSIIQTSAKEGMVTMDKAIKELLFQGKITRETALLELPDDQELIGRSAVQYDFSSELI
ncbi:MAG: type IV pilus twitching motility protein PilT [Peptococcales bacterium]